MMKWIRMASRATAVPSGGQHRRAGGNACSRAGCNCPLGNPPSRAGLTRVTIFFAIFAAFVSAGCMRLGFWQISRLHERRARNAEVLASMQLPAVILSSGAMTDTLPQYRPVSARGTYDFDQELVLVSRARNGAPGVHLITPLRLDDGSRVLVNRGWVYAPDGMRISREKWREDSAAAVEGYVEPFVPPQAGPVSTPSVRRGVRRLDFDSIAVLLPYPVRRLVIVQRIDSGEQAATSHGHPVRLELPVLDDGPHPEYAVQWFSFAAVGVFGTIYVIRRDLKSRSTG